VWIVGEIKDGLLRIGETNAEVYSPKSKTKVPDVLFYENVQVTALLLTLSLSITVNK